jgi:hypothetical protein
LRSDTGIDRLLGWDSKSSFSAGRRAGTPRRSHEPTRNRG